MNETTPKSDSELIESAQTSQSPSELIEMALAKLGCEPGEEFLDGPPSEIALEAILQRAWKLLKN